jgi:Zn-dependent M28 family amino/carboxypeptidase
MSHAVRSVAGHWWVVAVCVVVGLLAPAGASASSCDTQVNDTPAKLVPCVQESDLWNHMEAFEAIAQANPSPADGHPSRNSGEPGYLASAQYVAQKMTDAGYDVTLQRYTFTYFAYKAPPTMSEVSPIAHDYGLTSEWNSGQSVGTANAEIQPAGGIVIPPAPTSTSTSGCTAGDFTDFVGGRIALIQRGGCNFGVKVLNAKAAGATGVIIFNEGNPDRTSVLSGSLQDANNNPIIPDIPVAFTSFATGSDLLDQYQQAVQNSTPLPVMNITIQALVQPDAPDYNVIADSKGGNKNHVLVVDAHLDAIYGEGMLDNASGSSTILDIAEQMKNVNPLNKLRFIWFGGEELGLLGSKYYVGNLSSTQLSHIGYDLDADVTATPNYLIGILDPAGPDLFGRTVTSKFPNRVYKASTVSRDQSINYFDSIGKNHELLSPVGTDAYSFNEVGIPASGLLTGQDCCKSPEEVQLFGGTTGNYEGNLGTTDGGCVDNPFLWCDNLLNNNDPQVLTFMSKAFANTVVRMAFDNNVMASSNNAVSKQRLASASTTSRRFVAK